MGFTDTIKDIWKAICDGAKAIWNAAVKIVKAVINFAADCLNWLRDHIDRLLIKDSTPPVLVDWDKLIANAPEKDVGLFKKELGMQQGKRNVGVGFFNRDTRTLEHVKNVSGNTVQGIDELLEGEPLVILK